MLTEQEARERWCPFARDMQHVGGNRMAYGCDGTESAPGDFEMFAHEMADTHPCVGSKCMAWRWLDPDGWSGTPENQRKGYCGLAGRQE